MMNVNMQIESMQVQMHSLQNSGKYISFTAPLQVQDPSLPAYPVWQPQAPIDSLESLVPAHLVQKRTPRQMHCHTLELKPPQLKAIRDRKKCNHPTWNMKAETKNDR